MLWCFNGTVLCALWLLLQHQFTMATHTNNWAILVSTSKYWFNYRHTANTMAVYHEVKRLGIPDDNIILMLADDTACNPRNSLPGQIYSTRSLKTNLYDLDTHVDYRGYDVSADNFVRLMTNRIDPAVSTASKRLNSDENSNILVYLTGHGAGGFIKFQEKTELASGEIAHMLMQMHQQKRYKEMLIIADTCQAELLYADMNVPNVITLSSSRADESSYSYHDAPKLGVSVIDRFTHSLLEQLDKIESHASETSKVTLDTFFKSSMFSPHQLSSNMTITWHQFDRPVDQVLLTDFFGHVPHYLPAEPILESADLSAAATVQNSIVLTTEVDSRQALMKNNHRQATKNVVYESDKKDVNTEKQASQLQTQKIGVVFASCLLVFVAVYMLERFMINCATRQPEKLKSL